MPFGDKEKIGNKENIINMEERVRTIMSSILKVPIGSLRPDSSPDEIETWDSMQHLNLILSLEEEFHVKFSVEEVGEMQSLAEILVVLQQRCTDPVN